jgi:8-oxo-dGTP diphosphatase
MISILKKSKFINIVVSVAIKENQKYLLVKEAKKKVFGLWNFPAGKVEFGEGLFEAAKREFREETGFNCKITGLTGVSFSYWDDMPGLTIRFNFLGEIISKKKTPLANDILKTSWFSIKKIEKMNKNKELRNKATINQYKQLKKQRNVSKSIISEI